MTRKALTVRFDEQDDDALGLISKLMKMSKNQLIVQAVRALIESQSAKLADDVDALSDKLRKYAASDPGFEEAIDSFANAEAELVDPLEGKIEPASSSIVDEVATLLERA